MDTADIRAQKANRVTWVGFYVNLVLVCCKLFAGILGHSAAMIADALHSLSDFATDIAVLVCFRIIRKPVDRGHDYGHGKFETLATTIIGTALVLVGAGIFWSGARSVWAALVEGVNPGRPGVIALVAAGISVVSKEWLYRYTVRVGKGINSHAVIANAWHHRSDAFSSIGTTIGIGGAILLGEKWRVLDPIAAIIVSVFIVKVAVSITGASIRDLMEESLEDKVEEDIVATARNVKGVIEPHDLRTRRIGNLISVDLHIYVDANLKVVEGHRIASQVESEVRNKYGPETFVSVHVEPEGEGRRPPSAGAPSTAAESLP
jgi:cation diffusion facilitator family transporter